MRRGALTAGALALLAVALWGPVRRILPDRAARAKLGILEDVLRSRNDNDPRLDLDFKELSIETRRLFRRKYRSIPPERRNERGTIVYLLGMNLRTEEDWAFLRSVVSEPACLSLADCSKTADSAAGSLGDDVTLAYPSLVALRQAQRVLEESGAADAGYQAAAGVVRAARGSRAPAVIRMIDRIGARFKDI